MGTQLAFLAHSPLNIDDAEFDPKVVTHPLAIQGSLQSSLDIMYVLTYISLIQENENDVAEIYCGNLPTRGKIRNSLYFGTSLVVQW